MPLDLCTCCSLCLEHPSPILHLGPTHPPTCSSCGFPLHPWAGCGLPASSKLCAGGFHFLPASVSTPPVFVPAVDKLYQRDPLLCSQSPPPRGSGVKKVALPTRLCSRQPGGPSHGGSEMQIKLRLLQTKPIFWSRGDRAAS